MNDGLFLRYKDSNPMVGLNAVSITVDSLYGIELNEQGDYIIPAFYIGSKSMWIRAGSRLFGAVSFHVDENLFLIANTETSEEIPVATPEHTADALDKVESAIIKGCSYCCLTEFMNESQA